jgi:hypothetical protein
MGVQEGRRARRARRVNGAENARAGLLPAPGRDLRPPNGTGVRQCPPSPLRGEVVDNMGAAPTTLPPAAGLSFKTDPRQGGAKMPPRKQLDGVNRIS